MQPGKNASGLGKPTGRLREACRRGGGRGEEEEKRGKPRSYGKTTEDHGGPREDRGPDAFSRAGKTHLGRLREEQQEKERRRKSTKVQKVAGRLRGRLPREEDPDALFHLGKTLMGSGRLREDYGKCAEKEEEEERKRKRSRRGALSACL